MSGPIQLTSGSLAYYDSFSGMVPCKVLSIVGSNGRPSTAQTVQLQVTADRGPYRKGEKIETHGIHAVPRKAHYYRDCGIGRIKAYLVLVDGESKPWPLFSLGV